MEKEDLEDLVAFIAYKYTISPPIHFSSSILS